MGHPKSCTQVLYCCFALSSYVSHVVTGTLCYVYCAHINIHIYRFLAQHKLVFKSQMGKNVEGDMMRFQVSIHCALAQGTVALIVTSLFPCNLLLLPLLLLPLLLLSPLLLPLPFPLTSPPPSPPPPSPPSSPSPPSGRARRIHRCSVVQGSY